MHVLVGENWARDFLDPTPPDGHRRVHVVSQVALAPVDDQYFVRAARLSMLVSYVRSLGPRRVLRKVVSRRAESQRNDAWLSVGVGRLDGPDGSLVAFVATTGPRGSERVVVPDAVLHPIDEQELAATGWWTPVDGADCVEGRRVPEALSDLAGWRPESGSAPVVDDALWRTVVALANDPGRGYRRAADPPPRSEVRERTAAGPVVVDRSAYALFGYGQYAKTQVVPNLGAGLRLALVHEIDPLQMGPVASEQEAGAPHWDTSAVPRADDRIANAVLAGYHHTHAPLAAELIGRGARHVVIEKPIASSDAELDALVAAVDARPDARVHCAFQRRYSPFNPMLRADLGAGPISVASTVYEVPLPALHWYRWPVVGNAVVSNGCHWIDHFLFLNDFEAVSELDVRVLADQMVLCVQLRSGATCTVSLRHAGAPRLGVRDLCTFWTADATAVIEDNSRYVAERGFRTLRRASCHRYRSHEEMYQEFGRRIANDLPGDHPRSIEASGRAVLRLAALASDR